MTNKVMVIQDLQNKTFDSEAFTSSRNLVVEHCTTQSGALSAFQKNRYRCVVVSIDMENEDPLAIIGALRNIETALGLSPTQILVASRLRQLTQSEIRKFNIGGQIRSHRMS